MNLEDIRDIKPPVGFRANSDFLIIAAIIIALAALVFLIRFFKKRLEKKKDQILNLPKPAHQIALEALEALSEENLSASGKIKEYYFRLSDIIRRYIEERFEIRAPEMTTEEFLTFLRNSGTLSGAHKNLVKEFLNLCDIVKFANYGPTQKEIDESFAAAVKLVQETKEATESVL